jgi:hypothetical protein
MNESHEKKLYKKEERRHKKARPGAEISLF